MRHRTLTFIIALALAVISCGAEERRIPSEESKGLVTSPKETPLAETFEEYWRRSKAGDWEGVGKLLTAPPESFFLCDPATAPECRDEQRLRNESNSHATRSMVIEYDDSLIRKNVPGGIHRGEWGSYSVTDEATFKNEGRLRVNIKVGDGSLPRDILLSKSESSWKLIAIVDPGDVMHYAEAR